MAIIAQQDPQAPYVVMAASTVPVVHWQHLNARADTSVLQGLAFQLYVLVDISVLLVPLLRQCVHRPFFVQARATRIKRCAQLDSAVLSVE